jgi:hypothetical protein
MATLQGKAVKNTYRQVLQIGANNVGVSGTLQPVQDGAGVNTALSLSTAAATINGNLTITGDLIITGGGIEIKELIDDTVAALIQNGTGITWTYNDGANTLTGNFTGTTSVVPEGSNLYYTQGRFDSAFAAKSTTNLAEGTNLYFTEARGNANFATNFATKTTTNLPEGTNLYFTNARARTALSVTGGTGLSYDNTTGVFNLAAIPNASLANSSITINGQAISLGGTITLTTTNIAEGTNLYYSQARFDTAFSNKSTTDLAEGSNLYYTQARFNSALAAKTTTDLAEGSNLYYTDTRARLALSSSATGLSYANNSGVFSLTAGYAIPTTVKLGQYDTAYNRSIVSAAVTGTTTKTLSLTQQDANVVTATWTDLGITTINGTANQIAATTAGNTTTIAFTNDVTMPNNLVVSGNLTINGTATYVNTQSISAKDPLFEVANDNNTTDAVDIGYYGRYYDTPQTRVEFTGLFRDASDAGKFKFFSGLVDEPTNVVNTTGTGYTVGTLVANFEGNLAGTANAANQLSTARTIAASGDAVWSVSFDGSANVSSALTLANTGVTATTYGTSTAVPTIAVDSKGRITSASNTNITFPVTTVNGQAGTVVLTTSDIAEGSNQYFTSARAQAAISGTAPISVASGVVSISQSGGASNGFLSSTDWNTFNNKQAALNGTGFVKISGTTISYDNSTYLTTSAAASTYLALAGGTLTGGLSGTTGTFSGILTTPQVKAATSAGLSINANSGTQVADFGAGGSANITFFGGLSGTTATFSGNMIIGGTSLGADGVSLSQSLNYSFSEGSGNSYANVFRQFSSAATVIASGYKRSNTSNFASSFGTSMARAAIAVGYSSGSIAFFTDTATNVANGTDITATERMTISNTGTTTISATDSSGNRTNPFNVLTITANNPSGPYNEFGGSILFRNQSYFSGVVNSARIRSVIYNDGGGQGSGFIFEVTPTATGALTPAMTINYQGNVGIGTTSPTSLLHLRSASASGTAYLMTSAGGGTALTYRQVLNETSQQLNMVLESNHPMTFWTNSVQRMTVNANGIITIANLAAAGSRAVLADSSGNLSAPVSDISVKENITSIGYGLNEILKMNPVWFDFIDEYKNYGEGRQNGNIAQEMEAIIPEAVFTTPSTGKMGINYDQLHAVYIKAIQELKAEIDELKAK